MKNRANILPTSNPTGMYLDTHEDYNWVGYSMYLAMNK